MSFKYINSDNVGYTAGDADELESLDFGNLQPGQEKVMILRIGNTGSSSASFNVYGDSVNSGILSAFEISNDGDDYAPIDIGIVMSGIPPNGISEKIHIKANVPESAFTSDGTIRLAVWED